MWFQNDLFAEIDRNEEDRALDVLDRKRKADEYNSDEEVEARMPKKAKAENGEVKVNGNAKAVHGGINTDAINTDAIEATLQENQTRDEEDYHSDESAHGEEVEEGYGFETVPQEDHLGGDESSEYHSTTDSDTEDEKVITKKAKRLALGALLIRKKSRRALEDDMWNRFTHNEKDMPEWFAEDERKFNKPMLPITREQIAEMKARWREINARPIKKVAEARARKKKRAASRVAQAKEKAQKIISDTTLAATEKISSVQKLMKKAQEKRKERVYMVATKASTLGARNMKRGALKAKRAGGNARVKMVDGPMKKEARAALRRTKSGGRPKGKGRSSSSGKGRKK